MTTSRLAAWRSGVPSWAAWRFRPARADEVDDYTRKLIDLDQRVRAMRAEFKEAAPPTPDIADRRVLDAQVLFSLKNYEEAATILLDVVEKYPRLARLRRRGLSCWGSRCFKARDYYTARAVLHAAVKKKPAPRPSSRRCSA